VRVLLPLPDRDFDVTEVAVPWGILRDAGHQVVFATEKAGTVPAADPRLLTGVLFGQLGAAEQARKLYYELIRTAEFGSTLAWADLDPADFDGLVLPGGHAPGMRQYLGSPVLSEQVGRFWRLNRPVGAICHGVLVLARTHDPATGRSVLADRRTTCLPKYMERSAYLATAWRLGRYYRTYPAYVEDEVRAALANPDDQFERGPATVSARGTATDDRPAFVAHDRNYVSARWPGDAYLFARTVRDLLESERSLYRTDRSICYLSGSRPGGGRRRAESRFPALKLCRGRAAAPA
jgi:putative intracellular protease/amidase